MKLIDEWKQGYKFYSTWAIAVLAALPDLYNMLAAAGLFDTMPAAAQWTIRGGAVMVLIARFTRQKRPEDCNPP